MMRGLLVVLGLLLCPLFPAKAHETTRSYVTLARQEQSVDLHLRVAFRDIEVVVWMDEDLDGKVTWGEARRRLGAVTAYVTQHETLTAGGDCPLIADGAAPLTKDGIAYLDLHFTARCPNDTGPLRLETALFLDIDPDHRQLVQAVLAGIGTTSMLSAAAPSVTLDGDSGGAAASFLAYVRAGAEHLLAGADHLIFLLVLMLPAVCANDGPRRAATGVLAAVTGFTLAHALTLSAATTNLLRPPTDLINILIAVSIVITAIDNVRPFVPAPRAGVAALFGLIHGFGFATALGALDLTGQSLAVALLGFNIGIEAAQVGVVLLVMPALYRLGGGRVLLWVGSLGAAVTGMVWIVARSVPAGLW